MFYTTDEQDPHVTGTDAEIIEFYVPGPGGGSIHTSDPEVAQVGEEEAGDPYDGYNPRTHNSNTCYIDANICPGCSSDI